VVGAGDLVDEPKKIAVHYLRGYFALDVFVLLPLPQVSFSFTCYYLFGMVVIFIYFPGCHMYMQSYKFSISGFELELSPNYLNSDMG